MEKAFEKIQRSFVITLSKLELEEVFTKDMYIRPSANILGNNESLNVLSLKLGTRKDVQSHCPYSASYWNF